MRFFLFLAFFWVTGPAFSNDFVVCGWQIESDDERREVFDLSGAEAAPHAVHFSYYSAGQNGSGRLNHCGGSLIAPNWVLTARHCVGQKRWAHLGVDLPGLGAVVKADLAVCSAGDQPFPKNDVALLRLVEPLEGPFARIAGPIEGFPMSGHIARWPIRRGVPAASMLFSPIVIARETPTPMLSGAMAEAGRVPCGGESGSMLVDDAGDLAGVLTAISSPTGGRPDCSDPETRIFVTPLAGWAGWVERTLTACRAGGCVRPE